MHFRKDKQVKVRIVEDIISTAPPCFVMIVLIEAFCRMRKFEN